MDVAEVKNVLAQAKVSLDKAVQRLEATEPTAKRVRQEEELISVNPGCTVNNTGCG
jgi:hypothetical protein